MSYWVSEDSLIEDFEAVEEILGNFNIHLVCYLEADSEDKLEYDDINQEYLEAIEKYIASYRKKCDELEELVAKIKQQL